MASNRYLSRAPITEAVIDFRTQTAYEFRINDLDTYDSKFLEDYPKNEEISMFEFGVRRDPGKPPVSSPVDRGKIGIRFESKDGKYIAQLRKDGLTFSRLAPYTEWEQVFDEASRVFRIFAATHQPSEVSRIAVRYINRMLFPEEEVRDFKEFLTSPPPFPNDVDAFLTHFLTEVRIQEPDSSIRATVRQTIQQGKKPPGFVPVILDLDVYEMGTFLPIPDQILPRFSSLRDLKNRLFFASITESAAKLFE